MRREILQVRRALNSHVQCEIFLPIAKGTNTPSGIASLTEKSKFAVSLQLSSLSRTHLLKNSAVISADMRRKHYSIVWERIGEIFRQDHALELELYENHLTAETAGTLTGRITKTGLAISGKGKLGMVKEIVTERNPGQESKQANERVNRLIWEFVEFFKGYLRERRFPTLREYLLGAYEELSEHYARLPKKSESIRFFEFMDRAFERIEPVERIWRKHVREPSQPLPTLYKSTPTKALVLKLFAEAGSADYAGNYILNADAQAAIKSGTPLESTPLIPIPNGNLGDSPRGLKFLIPRDWITTVTGLLYESAMGNVWSS